MALDHLLRIAWEVLVAVLAFIGACTAVGWAVLRVKRPRRSPPHVESVRERNQRLYGRPGY